MRFLVDFLYLQGGRQSKSVYISIGAVVIRKSIPKKISVFNWICTYWQSFLYLPTLLAQYYVMADISGISSYSKRQL